MTFFSWLTTFLFSIAFISSTTSFKFLMLTIDQFSHISGMVEIALELGRRGHEAKVLVNDVHNWDEKFMTRVKDTNVSFIRYTQKTNKSFDDDDRYMVKFAAMMISGRMPEKEYIAFCNKMLSIWSKSLLTQNEELLSNMKSMDFDMAVVDGMIVSKHLHMLAHRLVIPWITYTGFPEPWLMRAPWLPSFVPGQDTLYTENMNLFQRVWNMIETYSIREMHDTVEVPQDIRNEYQKYGTFKSKNDLLERSKFWLITSNPVLDYPRPMMPNMVEIGGLTTKPANKLPLDIQDFLDGAKNGAILVTFGSMVSAYPDELFKKFFDAFNRIDDHRIIWRLENVTEGIVFPDHVKTGTWLPQNDILGHPKLKLFISHCGNNGQFESLYHKVPMIGFSFFADQPFNARRIEYKGYGISMDIGAFTSDELHSNIMKILNDSGYKRRISLASEIFKSDPQRPAEKAAYWIEHVTKYGSDHYQSCARNLNVFQYYMLDALAFCLAVGAIILTIIIKVLVWITNRSLQLLKKSGKFKVA